jgi:hypothetical protein
LLSFPPGTKMVHFPGFASRSLLYSGADTPILLGIPLKDSEIPRSKPVCGSLRLFAAYHVLLRLPSPRHPPYALSSLTIRFTLPAIPLGDYGGFNLTAFFFTRLFCLIVKDRSSGSYRKSRTQPRESLISSTSNTMVEVSGFEPLAPCLQSRCSSS